MAMFLKAVAIGSLALVGGLPAAAQTSAGDMTCGDFMALDQAGRNQAANAFQAYVMNPANSATASAADEIVHSMTTQEVHSQIEVHCQGQAASTNIVARMAQGMP